MNKFPWIVNKEAQGVTYGAGDLDTEDVRFCDAFNLVIVFGVDGFHFTSFFPPQQLIFIYELRATIYYPAAQRFAAA